MGLDDAFQLKTVIDKHQALAEAVGHAGLGIYYDLTTDCTIDGSGGTLEVIVGPSKQKTIST
jgi:hypothetical protein